MADLEDILVSALTVEEIASDGSTLTNPAADSRKLFLGEDGLWHAKDSAGTVTDIDGGREFDFVSGTGDTITATTEGGADTVITGNSVAYDGSTAIMIEFFAPYAQVTTSGSIMHVYVFEDGSSLGEIWVGSSVSATAQYMSCSGAMRRTPTAGNHTYSIRASKSGGTFLIGGGAGGSGATQPQFIRITRATS